ncbi:MAG: bifunctional diaminohydroxyphosphoribosylaminopyrimidine deaminase/5-amino-6-(5-phosphoribosylamino)uracil reductase RibD [Candidatus Geothermincolales bacterium]
MPMKEDVGFMKMALMLARKGSGMTHPNPMVGAVVVKDGQVVGKGYHRGPGTPHAEVMALREAGERSIGSTLYVNLEPCNHHGRTPPCTHAILESRVSRVVMAMRDPNPHVRGGGAERLRKAGLAIEEGVLQREAAELNRSYLSLVLRGRPWVTVKMAATADGKAAAPDGSSRWITGEEARRAVHRLRRECDAIMVGIGTAIADDPELTVRMVPLRSANPPLRVVVDSRLRLPEGNRLAKGGFPPVMVVVSRGHDRERAELLRKRGVEVVECGDEEKVDLSELLRLLGDRGVAHLLVEGGPELVGAFFRQGLVDEVLLFLAPRVLGNIRARDWITGLDIASLEEALELEWIEARRAGRDLVLRARPRDGWDPVLQVIRRG